MTEKPSWLALGPFARHCIYEELVDLKRIDRKDRPKNDVPPKKSLFKGLTRHEMSKVPGMGRGTIRKLEQWLGHPLDLDPLEQEEMDKRIQKAIAFLREHGYRVTKDE